MEKELDLTLLLNFVLNRFLIIFLICMVGAFTHDLYDTYKNLSPISIKRIFISSISGAIIMSAISEYIDMGPGILLLVCYCVGVWAFKMFEFLMNWSLVRKFLIKFFKNTKNAAANSLSEILEEEEKEEKKKEEDSK